mmetsp:Transcript_5459/g.8687  ORF Transcript_5459/g.8687 Transcript_5459/m.8687 type:complete len:226 (+) Transcript_5459:5137-5814(+)
MFGRPAVCPAVAHFPLSPRGRVFRGPKCARVEAYHRYALRAGPLVLRYAAIATAKERERHAIAHFGPLDLSHDDDVIARIMCRHPATFEPCKAMINQRHPVGIDLVRCVIQGMCVPRHLGAEVLLFCRQHVDRVMVRRLEIREAPGRAVHRPQHKCRIQRDRREAVGHDADRAIGTGRRDHRDPGGEFAKGVAQLATAVRVGCKNRGWVWILHRHYATSCPRDAS